MKNIEKILSPLKTECPSKFVIGIVAISVTFYVMGLQNEIESLNKIIEEKNLFISESNKSITNLQSAINTQNEFINKFKQDVIDKDNQFLELQEELLIQEKDNQDIITKMLQETRPKTCKEVEEYLRDISFK